MIIRIAGIYSMLVGVSMIAMWIMFYVTGSIPVTATEPVRILLHIVAEVVTAVALLVTQFFPFPFIMGGNQAMDSMRQICEDKGAKISSTEIINWSRRSRDLAINDCVARMSDSLLATAKSIQPIA